MVGIRGLKTHVWGAFGQWPGGPGGGSGRERGEWWFVNLLARYLSEVRKIRSLGSVPETSYYPPLSELLNAVGAALSPRVRCVVHPRSAGAGIPDLALFSADQIPVSGEPQPGVIPSRGVIEAKGTGEDVDKIAASKQVAKYRERYGQVLVTNLREFLLITDAGPGERFRLADSEAEFWSRADGSVDAAFVDFLKRALLSDAPLSQPKDVAWLLAYYAREARSRILGSNLEALQQLRGALEEALGITFAGDKGDNFFRSTLVQTLFYGIFSAWVLWSRRESVGQFDWRSASYELRVPMIKALFYQAADPSRLEPLGLVEVLDWAGAALNRVDREAFFTRFAADNAVQYFYEPFLEAFDPDLRKELGVWYTPREIVRYQVERVDTVLREELGVAAGLADPNVVVLDPCCGTGAYLVEVLRLIHNRLTDGGADMLALADVKRAATERVFGFEILPAPFVVAHLQLGLMMQTMGATLSEAANERVGVYLTNALTGWEGEPPQKAMIFPELLAERDAAGKVKRESKILVILGNPPYNGFAGVSVEEERSLSNAYRTVKNVPRPQGQGLNDLYVRFFRMAERRIVEGAQGKGIVCFISNYSWLDGLSFTGMRERYAEVFDRIYVDNGNGDKYRTGKVTPDGKPDPSVFSTPYNREGIQVGTAIATLVRRSPHTEDGAEILYREFWGKDKLAQIERAARDGGSGPRYTEINPPVSLGLPFSVATVGVDYVLWPNIPDLFPTSYPGIKTSRDNVVIDVDLARLKDRMNAYFSRSVSHDDMARHSPGSMEDAAKFSAVTTREHLQKRGLLPNNFVRHAYRPLDVRWLYWEPETNLIDRKRDDYFSEVSRDSWQLAAVAQNRKEFDPPQAFMGYGSLHLVERGANLFPQKLKAAPTTLFDSDAENPDGTRWNLSEQARAYLASLDAAHDTLFFHALAVLHSPAYRTENSGALRQDWPRIPLPATRDALEASAGFGRQIAALLDTETPVPGVTAPPLRDDLKTIATLTHADRPGLEDGDLAVTAGWGNQTKTGVMPGRGKVDVRPDGTLDIYLNDKVAWRGIPVDVWKYTIGGYQVMKKWLSYRELGVIGRALTIDEAREVQHMARRIAALVGMAGELDGNYARVR
jgi:hypothetical protein